MRIFPGGIRESPGANVGEEDLAGAGHRARSRTGQQIQKVSTSETIETKESRYLFLRITAKIKIQNSNYLFEGPWSSLLRTSMARRSPLSSSIVSRFTF